MRIIKKIATITDKGLTTSIFLFFLLTIGSVVVETITIGSIIPLVSTLIDFDLIKNNELFIKYFPNSSSIDKKEFITYSVIFLLIILIIKFLLQIIIINFTQKIQNRFEISFQTRLLNYYLSRNWEFHLENDSSKLIRLISYEAAILVSKLIIPLIQISSEILLILSIFTFLMIYNYKATLVIFFVTLLVGMIINFLTKKKVKVASEKRLQSAQTMTKKLLEIFSILKEILVSKNKEIYIKNYQFYLFNLLNNSRIIAVLNTLPKIIFELVLGLVICFSFLIGVHTFESTSNLLILLALYAATSLRLIPSFSRILQGMQSISFGKPVLDQVYEDLKISKTFIENTNAKISFTKQIELIDLSYKRPGGERILENINCKFKKNQLIGIIGESGSGKSTLINLICGLIKPSYGKILIDDKIFDHNKDDLNLGVGYVGQNPKLIDASLMQNITGNTRLNPEQKKIYLKLIEDCGLSKLNDSLEKRDNKNIGENEKNISGGEKQRISIARAMFLNPEIIILDEPTSSLDQKNEDKIIDLISKFKQKKTIFFITHNNRLLKKFDLTYQMHNGKIK